MSELLDAPQTPDFAQYRWDGLAAAVVEDDWVTCRWDDVVSHRFFGIWLWENAVGCGTDPTTRELMIDPADLPTGPVVATVGVAADGALSVGWANGTSSRFHPGWLRSVADGAQLPKAALGQSKPWPLDDWQRRSLTSAPHGADFINDGAVFPPTFDGRLVLHNEGALRDWLEAAVDYGVARLTGLGEDPDMLTRLAGRIGPIRSTNFGSIFSVQSVVRPTAEQNSVANTGLMLGQHTDLPSRETPPGFQMLHCVANTTAGGWASMTDGVALVEHLRCTAPDDFEALTTLRWVFANRSPDADHRWSGPMIELPESGRPLTLRCFYPVRAYPDMDDDDVERSYAAMRRFSKLSRDAGFAIRFPYAVGDLVAFDNRRVLHGRDAFDPTGGERHLRGCYFDHDDVYSRLRVLRRRRKEPR